jgi:hypothetical protein
MSCTSQSLVGADAMHVATVGKNSSATTADYAPYMQQLNDALTTASSSLSTIKSTRAIVERQSETEIATTVAGVVSVRAAERRRLLSNANTPLSCQSIATTLDGIVDTSVISSLLPGLDTDLNAVLSGLETLLAGVLNLVATLFVIIFRPFGSVLTACYSLVDVAGLLQNLALGLTLGSLGL